MSIVTAPAAAATSGARRMLARRPPKFWAGLAAALVACYLLVMGGWTGGSPSVERQGEGGARNFKHRQVRRRPTREVPVHIFEEHQQALPIWWEHRDRANPGARLSDMLVVHIDGHSDFGTPSELDMEELHDTIYVAENDDFIHRAITLGIASQVIWVKPDWLTWIDGWSRADELSGTGQRVNADSVRQTGFYKEKRTQREASDQTCECNIGVPFDRPLSGEDADDDDFEWSCRNGYGDGIEHQQCIESGRARVRVMPEFHVPIHGLTFSSVPGNDDSRPIILDIDEDYFAVEDPVEIVRQAGWTNRTLRLLDDVVRQFCVADEEEEAELAELLQGEIMKPRFSGSEQDDSDFLCDDADADTFDDLLKQLHAAMDEAIELTLANPPKGDVIPSRHGMKRAIEWVGFAAAADLAVWPKFFQMTLGVDNVVSEPEDDRVWETNDLVAYYSPSDQELETMLGRFRSWLVAANIAHRVKLVTLCRSARDGYLPRRLQARIEEGILAALQDMFDIDVEEGWARPSW